MAPKLSQADREAIFRTARNLQLDPYEFGAVLNQESGFRPNVWGGAGGKYYGIIQFGGPERSEAGLDPKRVAAGDYTIAEQMPAVERWLKGRGYKPGMGVDKVYATILGGNPNVSLDSKDSFGTSVNNSLSSFKPGGSNYEAATVALNMYGDAPPSQTNTASQPPTTPGNVTINNYYGDGTETKQKQEKSFAQQYIDSIISGKGQKSLGQQLVQSLMNPGGGYSGKLNPMATLDPRKVLSLFS